MIKKTLRILPALLGLALLASCLFKKAEPLSVEMQPFTKRYCVNDQQCADFNVVYPLFRGGDSVATAEFNQKLHSHLGLILGLPPRLPFESALDSSANMLIEAFLQAKRNDLEMMDSWMNQLICSVPLLNKRVATIEVSQYLYTGAFNNIVMTHLISYDFTTGEYLKVSDLIADTTAFRPMLEAAFCKAHSLKSTNDISKMLLHNFSELPMPQYAAATTDGVRVLYNWQQYAPRPFPLTNLMFTWEELGILADKKKWLD